MTVQKRDGKMGFVIKGGSDMASLRHKIVRECECNRERDEWKKQKTLNWKSDTLKIYGSIREIYAPATDTH